MKKWLKKFWKDEQGLELSEYAIMAALIIVIAIVAITTMGGYINDIFTTLGTKLGAAAAAGN